MSERKVQLDYHSRPPPFERWRYFRVTALATGLWILLLICDHIATNGHKNPRLWLMMPPSDHWRGYLGMGARELAPWLALLTLLAAICDLILLYLHGRWMVAPVRAKKIRGFLLAIIIVTVLFLGLLPSLDR